MWVVFAWCLLFAFLSDTLRGKPMLRRPATAPRIKLGGISAMYAQMHAHIGAAWAIWSQRAPHQKLEAHGTHHRRRQTPRQTPDATRSTGASHTPTPYYSLRATCDVCVCMCTMCMRTTCTAPVPSHLYTVARVLNVVYQGTGTAVGPGHCTYDIGYMFLKQKMRRELR